MFFCHFKFDILFKINEFNITQINHLLVSEEMQAFAYNNTYQLYYQCTLGKLVGEILFKASC